MKHSPPRAFSPALSPPVFHSDLFLWPSPSPHPRPFSPLRTTGTSTCTLESQPSPRTCLAPLFLLTRRHQLERYIQGPSSKFTHTGVVRRAGKYGEWGGGGEGGHVITHTARGVFAPPPPTTTTTTNFCMRCLLLDSCLSKVNPDELFGPSTNTAGAAAVCVGPRLERLFGNHHTNN